MSDHNLYEIFPTSIATALHRAYGSYLVKNGVAVRHKNQFEELIVSFPNIDVAFPDYFSLYQEGFRDAPVEVIQEVIETIPETAPEAPQEVIEVNPVITPIEEIKEPVEAPTPFPFPTTASIEAAKSATKTEDKPKAKPGRKPKADKTE